MAARKKKEPTFTQEIVAALKAPTEDYVADCFTGEALSGKLIAKTRAFGFIMLDLIHAGLVESKDLATGEVRNGRLVGFCRSSQRWR